jgi:two-component system OmpR family sensor kinase
MKLNNRLMGAVTGVTVAALAVSFLPLYLLVRAKETSDLDNALFRHASAFAAHLPGTWSMGHPLDEGHADVPESLDPTVRYVALFGPDDRLRSASDSFDGQAPATLDDLRLRGDPPWDGVAVDLELGDIALRGVVLPLGDQGQTLLYAVSRRSVDDDMLHLLELLTAIFLVSAGSTALVARFLGQRLARDVDAVARVARSVAGGDFSARVGAPSTMGAEETRALARDLDAMIERLDELVSSQRRFVSHAAHELRSPLATLRGELQLALRRDRDVAEYRAALAEMLSSVDALIALAEDLLRLARAQEQQNKRPQGTALIADVVRAALQMARGHAEARGVALVVRPDPLPEFPTPIRGAVADLARVLRNLIDNAVKHGPADAPVVIETAIVEGGVELAVVDHGPGLAPEDQPHIFTPFYRGADASVEQGVGLGLSIARGIAEGCGGRLSYDSRHSPGARFVLHLPFAT